jgi:hypothetical protein
MPNLNSKLNHKVFRNRIQTFTPNPSLSKYPFNKTLIHIQIPPTNTKLHPYLLLLANPGVCTQHTLDHRQQQMKLGPCFPAQLYLHIKKAQTPKSCTLLWISQLFRSHSWEILSKIVTLDHISFEHKKKKRLHQTTSTAHHTSRSVDIIYAVL